MISRGAHNVRADGVRLMSDLNPDRWAKIVVLSRLGVQGATAALSERRRQALEELIAEVERLHPGVLQWSVTPRSNEKSPTPPQHPSG